MKLELDGKKRLEAMKKTLAAGLPLAGLLAASVAAGGEAQGCASNAEATGESPAEVREPWVTDGDIVEVELEPISFGEYVTMGVWVTPPLIPEEPEVPEEPDEPEEPADGEEAGQP